MSNNEDKSVQISFRCPNEHYRPIQIILGQGLDPRVKTVSDVCNQGIIMYYESVEAYTSRPDVRKALQVRRALQEAKFKEDTVAMQNELRRLSYSVGNGQFSEALDQSENDVKLFLPEGYQRKQAS